MDDGLGWLNRALFTHEEEYGKIQAAGYGRYYSKMTVAFSKYHALGNDYIVLDPNKTKLEPTADRIKRICHRNYGIGSDGILYGPVIEDGRISLRIFNPDGSEAEKSGNGIRIFARYLFDEKYVAAKQFETETLGGKVQAEYLDDAGVRIRVAMGTVTFFSTFIPVSGAPREVVDETMTFCGKLYRVTCVSIGNPHCVIPVEKATKELACSLGPEAENGAAFPNRINMQLLEVMDRQNIRIEIWERGAGYTLASGSSSCAAAGAAYRLGLVDNDINVHMPGGTIHVLLDDDGTVYRTGTVNSVCTGTFSEQFLSELLEMG